MITGFLLQILYVVVAFFVGLLPTIDVPVGWTSSIALMMSYVNGLSWLFPVSTLLSVLGLAVTFHVALLGYDLSIKIYHMLRG